MDKATFEKLMDVHEDLGRGIADATDFDAWAQSFRLAFAAELEAVGVTQEEWDATLLIVCTIGLKNLDHKMKKLEDRVSSLEFR